jgi:hypothetical protein
VGKKYQKYFKVDLKIEPDQDFQSAERAKINLPDSMDGSISQPEQLH